MIEHESWYSHRIQLQYNEENVVKINSFHNKYELILNSLFDDNCELVSPEDKDIILDKCLKYYDDLDDIGFSDGSIKIPLTKKNEVKQFILNL